MATSISRECQLMRNMAVILSLGAELLVSASCGSKREGTAPYNGPYNGPIVYLHAGQTIKHAVDSLPPTGGTVYLGVGTWTSGYNSTGLIAKPNVTIQGSGIPGYNSNFTAMSGGSIVQGPLLASTGADHFTVRDLGVDAGPAYINANNAGVPTDALAIFNNGQVVGAPKVESPLIENVSCLGYSPTAPAHCMLIENVNHAYIHNVVAVMNLHGFVLKGTNSVVDGVLSSGHSITSVIVKSDNYAPSSQDNLSNITIEPLFRPGDTRGISVIGVAAPVSGISISNVRVYSPLDWGIHVQGTSSSTSASGIGFSNISIEYQGESPIAAYCMQVVQYVTNVNISNLNCSNMWAGIAPYLPAAGAFNDFTVRNSQFTNIGTNGIETYGSWNVFYTSFGSIAGNAIMSDSGVTTVSGDTFTEIGGADMYSAGGTFVVLTPEAWIEFAPGRLNRFPSKMAPTHVTAGFFSRFCMSK
jgi:hypothetical protein